MVSTNDRARLVLGWVTVYRRVNHLCNRPVRPTQPPTFSGTENEYRSKCGDALRLGSKGRYGSFHLLYDPSFTCAMGALETSFLRQSAIQIYGYFMNGRTTLSDINITCNTQAGRDSGEESAYQTKMTSDRTWR